MDAYRLHPEARIGHVHLRVADLDRALAFYRDALGFGVTLDGRTQGLPLVLLATGEYHHHVALNTWHSAGAPAAPDGHAGLHHVAFLYPTRDELGKAVAHLYDIGYPVDGAQDHGGTLSVYLRDPDGNGIELTWDRPRHEWFDAHGNPIVMAEAVDPRSLIQLAASAV